MAILKKKGDGYNGADFQIVTGDDAFDEEFKDMLKVTKDELIAAVIGEILSIRFGRGFKEFVPQSMSKCYKGYKQSKTLRVSFYFERQANRIRGTGTMLLRQAKGLSFVARGEG